MPGTWTESTRYQTQTPKRDHASQAFAVLTGKLKKKKTLSVHQKHGKGTKLDQGVDRQDHYQHVLKCFQELFLLPCPAANLLNLILGCNFFVELSYWCRNVKSKWSCTTAAVIIRYSSQQPRDDLSLLHQHSFWVLSSTNSPNSSHSFTIWSINRLGLARNRSPGKCNSADRISSYHYPQQTKVTPGNFESMSAQE